MGRGRGIAEDRQAVAKGGDGEHEDAGGSDAKGSEGESGKVAESPFHDKEVECPDGHECGDGKGDNDAGRRAGDGGVYAHGQRPG